MALQVEVPRFMPGSTKSRGREVLVVRGCFTVRLDPFHWICFSYSFVALALFSSGERCVRDFADNRLEVEKPGDREQGEPMCGLCRVIISDQASGGLQAGFRRN